MVLLLTFACSSGDPLSGCDLGVSPTTIDGVVGQIDALPEPSVACFLASLERPLQATAAFSATSTQPAGERDPRVFLVLDDLVVTTIVSGDHADRLELGERHDASRSVKAEIDLALADPDPFGDVREGEGTRCAVCHAGEEEVQEGRFASRALRPHVEQIAPIGDGALEHLACVGENARCDRLRGLYGFGRVEEAELGPGFDLLF
ncbi:MAG: hypothetical protein KC656_09955 [Myxococcales bacterium]|nr:hypothetical protein [Myxococcales bacterium]